MLNTREKLIELLKKGGVAFPISTADHLIANGVTVPDTNVGKWIPVSDPPGKKGCYIVTVKHWCDGKPVTREAFYNISGWISCERGVDITERVTHWMPLPEPPKED